MTKYKVCLAFLVGVCFLSGCEAEPSAAPQPSSPSEPASPVPQNREQIQMSFSPVVKKTSPAVVSIYALKVQKSPFLQDPIFKFFFGGADLLSNRVEKSLGSGTVIRPDGTVITNLHVVQNSEQIKVVLSDSREFDADIVVQDAKSDLAILKLRTPQRDFPYLQLADSDAAEVGDLVLAIGNPFGFSHTVTNGIVSAIGRTHLRKSQAFIQTDAAINQGNSGGALVTLEGKLLGVCTFIISRSGGSDSIGFAIPANTLKPVIEAVEHGGRIIRPWAGVMVQDLTPTLAESLGLERPTGVIITRVFDQSAAERAHLQDGDVIVQIEGHPVPDEDAFQARISSSSVGSNLTLSVVKKGNHAAENVTLTLEAPPEVPLRDQRSLKGNMPLSGLDIANLSPALAAERGFDLLQTGVVTVAVAPGSPADALGLTEGDVIVKVNGVAITSTGQLQTFTKAALPSAGWRLIIRRGRQNIMLTVS